jgi:hypothetical protein
VRIGEYNTAGQTSTGVALWSSGAVTIAGSIPNIEFHYNNSATFTSKITENVAGTLTAKNVLQCERFNFGTNYPYYLNESGDISARTVSQTSDRNDKKDIEDISDKYIELWDKLSVKTYRYINDDKVVRVGLIAQDVEEWALKVGLTLEDCGFIGKRYIDNDIYKGYKYSIDYISMAMITMAKVKQIVDIINQHDKRIQELEDEIAILKARINHMQSQYA